MANRRCEFTKPGGTRCGAMAVAGKRHCVFHDRGSAAKMADARKRGGENRKTPAATLPPDTPPLKLKTVADVTAALGETYNLVRVGKLAVAVGNCLAVIGQGLLKSMEKGDLERRIEELESRGAKR